MKTRSLCPQFSWRGDRRGWPRLFEAATIYVRRLFSCSCQSHFIQHNISKKKMEGMWWILFRSGRIPFVFCHTSRLNFKSILRIVFLPPNTTVRIQESGNADIKILPCFPVLLCKVSCFLYGSKLFEMFCALLCDLNGHRKKVSCSLARSWFIYGQHSSYLRSRQSFVTHK